MKNSLTVETSISPEPTHAELPMRNRWIALGALLTGAFLPILDFNIINLALPAIHAGLRASASQLQFVISGYAAVYAVFLVAGGRLGDLYGRKRLFLVGVAGFVIASVACATATNADGLVAARMFQGLAATLMAPQVLASIRVLFPASEQSTALALYGATYGLANICGQTLGGLLVSSHWEGMTWQPIFLINIPIGLAAIAGAVLFVPDHRAARAQKLDSGGIALFSLSLLLLIYPLVAGREAGWPRWSIAMLASSPLALAAFVRYEARLASNGGDPLVDITLFRNRRFSTGLAMAAAFYTLSSFYLTFAIYLQNGLGMSPLAAGGATVPFAIAFFLSSLASARAMRVFGFGALTCGFAVQVAGFSMLALAAKGDVRALLPVALAVAGAGFGLVVPSLIKAVIGHLEARHAGMAAGIVMSTLQIGSAVGIATIGSLFFSLLGTHPEHADYSHAFVAGMACNVALLALCGALSARMGERGREQK